MITCSLMGGLGNQLFQIFATISYAIKSNNEFKFLNVKTLGGNGCTLRYTFWNTFLNSLQPFLTDSFPKLALVKQESFEYKELPISLLKNRNVCIHGYFQSYKFFEQHFSLIYRLLDIETRTKEVFAKLSDTFKDNISNSISMHFRLGDYKKVSYFHPIMPSSYYLSSLKYILVNENVNEIKEKDISKNVIYFCEDEDIQTVEETIRQCKEEFPNLNFIRAPNVLEDWEQMLLMSECNHHIIANSSFSWWGAYIGFKNENKINQEQNNQEQNNQEQNNQEQNNKEQNNQNNNKIICYPSLWFVPTAEENTKDMYPCEWTKIEI